MRQGHGQTQPSGRESAGNISDLRSPADGGSSDFDLSPAETPEQALSLILKGLGGCLPARTGFDPVAQGQVLCPQAPRRLRLPLR